MPQTADATTVEPFKNRFNPELIQGMADHLAKHCAAFSAAEFVQQCCDGLAQLELKARSLHIRDALTRHLPSDFDAAAALLTASLHPEQDAELADMKLDAQGIRGWAIMPMAEWVAQHGAAAADGQRFDAAMLLLQAMTQRFTAEFAIRPFFIANQQRALEWSMRWAASENRHVRRLASEGSRTRLPWGLRLQGFIDDPAPLWPLLELLKDDSSEYVRRSVANNINDLAKDHPEQVAELAAAWLIDASPARRRLVNHACRGLVKQGHPPTLAALGYGEAQLELQDFQLAHASVQLGEKQLIELTITSTAATTQALIIDYAVHHQKANGSQSAKIFKWKKCQLGPGQRLTLSKSHSFKAVTTRKYYAGVHSVELLINGKSMAQQSFMLAID